LIDEYASQFGELAGVLAGQGLDGSLGSYLRRALTGSILHAVPYRTFTESVLTVHNALHDSHGDDYYAAIFDKAADQQGVQTDKVGATGGDPSSQERRVHEPAQSKRQERL
jgi:hypothetical protein